MSKQPKNTLREWFRRGLKPTQQQFWDWLDSFWHKDEPIPASTIDGLQGLLDAKVDKKDTVDPDQVGPYNPATTYVFDAARAEYVSFSNAGSAEPQFQVEGFYRLTENAPAGENPETHPGHWAYQGYTIGEITIDDVAELNEALKNRQSIQRASLSRAQKLPAPPVIGIDYNGRNLFRALSILDVPTASNFVRSNDANADEASYWFDITNLSPITFPDNTGKVMIEGGAGSWNDDTKVFTPAVNGVFLFEEKRQGDTYYLKVFSESVDGQGTGGGGDITVDAVPTKGSVNAVASGGVYKTIKESFLVESLSDYGFISRDEDFKVTAVVAATGLTITLKKSDDTAYTLGDTITGGDYLKVFGDTLNKTATIKGEII